MNDHDSERIAGLLKEQDYHFTDDPKTADIILINTCSIREKSEHKAYSELGRYAHLKNERPEIIVGMAGCVAQREGNKVFKRYPWVDLAFGSANIPDLPNMIKERQSGKIHVLKTDQPPGPPPSTPAIRKDPVRAWVTIMEGCNKHCSFCVVPGTRGKERSRPATEIIQEVRNLGERGYKEVTLLGQTVNSYGKGSSTDFSDLLWRLNDLPGIERIRFMTSHPMDLSDKLIQTIAMLPKVCEHLHLPLQSGSDSILEKMNRNYTFLEYFKKIQVLRKVVPSISLTSDIIVGHPGETDQDFEKTIDAIQQIRFDGIFAFKYSPRPGTPAAGSPNQVPEDIKDYRLRQLLMHQKIISDEQNTKWEDTVQQVLVDGISQRDSHRLIGRTRTHRAVRFQGNSSMLGSLINVRIKKAVAPSLEGEVIH